MIVEMRCLGCGEHFPLGDPPDEAGVIEHYEREDGTPCGSTQTEFAGTWVTRWDEPGGPSLFVPSKNNRHLLAGETPPPPRDGDAAGLALFLIAMLAGGLLIILTIAEVMTP